MCRNHIERRCNVKVPSSCKSRKVCAQVSGGGGVTSLLLLEEALVSVDYLRLAAHGSTPSPEPFSFEGGLGAFLVGSGDLGHVSWMQLLFGARSFIVSSFLDKTRFELNKNSNTERQVATSMQKSQAPKPFPSALRSQLVSTPQP